MTDLATQESRAARRLGRLFRIERRGGFARRPAETVWRLIARRGTLMAELFGLEGRRRAVAAAEPSPELEAALSELADEVARSREHGEAVVADLGSELRARRGNGAATGLRDLGADGRLLGRG